MPKKNALPDNNIVLRIMVWSIRLSIHTVKASVICCRNWVSFCAFCPPSIQHPRYAHNFRCTCRNFFAHLYVFGMNFVAGESNKLTPPERHHKPSLGSSTPTSGSSQPTVINILPSTSAAAAAATYSFAGQASSTTAAEDPEDLDNIVNPVITDHMLYLFATFDNKIDVGRLKRNIQFLERPAHLDEMMNGKINLLPSLTVFVNHPFVIHFDEYHLKHMLSVYLTKVPIYIDRIRKRQSKLGSEKIKTALDIVLKTIVDWGLSDNLMAIVSDHNKSNFDALHVATSKQFPVIWDIFHQRNIPSFVLKTDVTVQKLYELIFTADNLSAIFKGTPTNPSNKTEVDGIQKMIQKYFATAGRPPLQINRIDSSKFEMLGRLLATHMANIMMYATSLPFQMTELKKNQLYHVTRIVALILLINTPKFSAITR